MNVKKVCCQGCGADLDIAEGLRFVTCNFCGSKLEIIHDKTTTHSRLLEQIGERTEAMAGDLRIIKLQNELERLDREWDQERGRYLVTDKNGNRSEPGSAGSIIGGGIAIGIGLLWMIAASSMGAPGPFPLFGLVFIGVAVLGMVSSTSKATRLQQRRRQYEEQREKLLRAMAQGSGAVPPPSNP